MARVVVSIGADRYCLHSDGSCSQGGAPIAAKYLFEFESLYERLADHPDSGLPRPSIGEDVRIGIVSPYIVIYEHDPANDIVTIFRIVHGRRKITGALLRGD
jgi:toxin ParE1/3/4